MSHRTPPVPPGGRAGCHNSSVSPELGSSGPELPTATAAGRYTERLVVPLRWWAVATMFWASVLLAFLVALPTTVALVFAGVLAALTATLFLGYGGAPVTLADGVFRAGRAAVPVRLLAEPEPLDADETRRTAGVEADARAYLLLRPYIRGAVRVQVADPADPTPYWLVSTRHPRTLASELAAAIDAAPAPGLR